MDNASLVRGHWFKRKRDACLSHTIRSEIGHRLQLGLTRRAKSVDVANQPFSGGEASSEHLVDQVLQRFEQFSGLGLKQFGVTALDIQYLATDRLLHVNAQLQARHVEDVFKKLCCLLSSLTHRFTYLAADLKSQTARDPVVSSASAAALFRAAPELDRRPT